jgi:hypothetical protein
MPLHIVQLKSKLAKMSAPAGASESLANLIKTVFPNSFTRLAELDLRPAALEVQQKLLVSKAEAFISAAIDTLKNNGEDRWMSQDFMWGCLTELCLQAYFARWLYAKVLIVETDSFNFTAVLLPGVEVLEKMQSVYWTDGLAAQMRGQWQRWLAAGDLGYAPYARFVSDLQKMGEGTYVNIALEDNAFRELYRLVWFSININAVILEATFNQLDNQMVKKISPPSSLLLLSLPPSSPSALAKTRCISATSDRNAKGKVTSCGHYLPLCVGRRCRRCAHRMGMPLRGMPTAWDKKTRNSITKHDIDPD